VIDLLFEASRTGGVAMVLAAMGSVTLGSIGTILSAGPMSALGGPMMKLARTMAVFCGVAGLLGALAGVPYYRMVGQVGFEKALLAEAGLVGVTAVWLVVVAVLLTHADGKKA